jgi:hypothetical protein
MIQISSRVIHRRLITRGGIWIDRKIINFKPRPLPASIKRPAELDARRRKAGAASKKTPQSAARKRNETAAGRTAGQAKGARQSEASAPALSRLAGPAWRVMEEAWVARPTECCQATWAAGARRLDRLWARKKLGWPGPGPARAKEGRRGGRVVRGGLLRRRGGGGLVRRFPAWPGRRRRGLRRGCRGLSRRT